MQVETDGSCGGERYVCRIVELLAGPWKLKLVVVLPYATYAKRFAWFALY